MNDVTKPAVKNYTDTDIEVLNTTYVPTDSDDDRSAQIDTIAKELDKTRSSVIAKLSSLKLYVKPATSTKSKVPVITKDEYVEKIAKLMDLPSDLLPGLEKPNKATLIKILASLEENA